MGLDFEFDEGISQEDYDTAGSKFASVGTHESECGALEWETPGKSIRFPFTITEEGEDYGKQNKFVIGVSKDALWKAKEMEKALGFGKGELIVMVDGRLKIPEEKALACMGRKFQSVWTPERDTRPVSEGGTGKTYAKPTSAIPIGATVEELIPDETPF